MQKLDEKLTSKELLSAFQKLNKQDYDGALEEFDKAMEKAKSNNDKVLEALVYSGYGIYFKIKKDYKKAWKNYDKAEKLLPDDPSLKTITARLLIQAFNQYDIAIRKMEKVMVLSKGDPVFCHQAHSVMGFAYLKMKKKDKAAEQLSIMAKENFEDLSSAGNIDLTLVEMMMVERVNVDACKSYIETAFEFAKKHEEKVFANFFKGLLDNFPKYDQLH